MRGVTHIYIYIRIYIYAVKLKTGPNVALFKVKNWSFFLENLVLPAERRIFSPKKQEREQQKSFLKLKTGPTMLRNMLGSIFNFNLDQVPTPATPFFSFFLFFCFCFFCLGGGLKPYFYSVFSKNANWKKHKHDTICEHTCANCSCQNVLFFAFFVFAVFPCFWEMFLSNKIWKQQKQKQQQLNKMQSKKSKIVIHNKTRQQTEKQKQKNILKQKANKPTAKSKNQKLTWETGSKEERKGPERDKERESEKWGRPTKRLKRNKRKHWKMNHKIVF